MSLADLDAIELQSSALSNLQAAPRQAIPQAPTLADISNASLEELSAIENTLPKDPGFFSGGFQPTPVPSDAPLGQQFKGFLQGAPSATRAVDRAFDPSIPGPQGLGFFQGPLDVLRQPPKGLGQAVLGGLARGTTRAGAGALDIFNFFAQPARSAFEETRKTGFGRLAEEKLDPFDPTLKGAEAEFKETRCSSHSVEGYVLLRQAPTL